MNPLPAVSSPPLSLAYGDAGREISGAGSEAISQSPIAYRETVARGWWDTAR